MAKVARCFARATGSRPTDAVDARKLARGRQPGPGRLLESARVADLHGHLRQLPAAPRTEHVRFDRKMQQLIAADEARARKLEILTSTS